MYSLWRADFNSKKISKNFKIRNWWDYNGKADEFDLEVTFYSISIWSRGNDLLTPKLVLGKEMSKWKNSTSSDKKHCNLELKEIEQYLLK